MTAQKKYNVPRIVIILKRLQITNGHTTKILYLITMHIYFGYFQGPKHERERSSTESSHGGSGGLKLLKTRCRNT